MDGVYLSPDQPSGHVQLEPPSYHTGVNGPQSTGGVATTFSGSAAMMPAVSGADVVQSQPGAVSGGRAGKRQYAANQTAAYGYDNTAGAGPDGMYGGAPGSNGVDGQYGQQGPDQPGQFFSPALGGPSMQAQQFQPQQSTGYPGQSQQYPQQQPGGVIGPGAPVHGQQQMYGQGYPQQQQGQMQPQQQGGYMQQGQQHGIQGLTNQFAHMGVQPRPLQTANLIGYPLDPRGIDEPPPDIRLPPGVSDLSRTS